MIFDPVTQHAVEIHRKKREKEEEEEWEEEQDEEEYIEVDIWECTACGEEFESKGEAESHIKKEHKIRRRLTPGKIKALYDYHKRRRKKK